MKFIKVLSYAMLIGCMGFASEAYAAKSECDFLIGNLLAMSGGCHDDNRCRYTVENGQLVGQLGATVVKDSIDATAIREVQQASRDQIGMSYVRLQKLKDGALNLKFTAVDTNGGESQSEYRFTVGERGRCIHEQTQKKMKNDRFLTVEFDREFCLSAEKAFASLTPAAAKTCDDAMKNLVSKYHERSEALAKNRETFRASSDDARFNAFAIFQSSGDASASLIQALQQRDACTQATAEVNLARPITKKFAAVSELLKAVLDKRGGGYSSEDSRKSSGNGVKKAKGKGTKR